MPVAYATLVTNDAYGIGALALARSLRRSGTAQPLLVLATEHAGQLDALTAEGARIVPVRQPELSAAFKERHGRPALHAREPFTKGTKPAFHDPLDNFCKLRLWELEAFEKIVFIDADALVLRNVDRLFAYPAFAAAPNLYAGIGDMTRMNSGVFVMAPDPRRYESMIATLDAPDAFWRRTDQTFLEHCFPDWHGLPYTYNVLQYVYFNLPELWHWPSLKILHYQYEKPWDLDHARRDELAPLIQLWHRMNEGGELPDQLPTRAAACASP